MNICKMTDDIVGWMQQYVAKAGAKGVAVGLSGGIDSAVVAALSSKAFPIDCLGVIMPCYSQEMDLQYGEMVATKFNLTVKKVVLDTVYDNLIKAVGEEGTILARANIKPRLRMTTLYFLAGTYNYLVAGTGNKSELETGYFTKYGDGGVDFEPIGHLLKTEVQDLARFLGVPKEIIDRPPTAGLWQNQTDEQEMGISYQELDCFILTGEGSEQVKRKFTELHCQSEHKRHLPPVPTFK